VAAYRSLETLKPESLINLHALDSFLSWQSHQSQHSTNFFYHLNVEIIKELDGDTNLNNTLLKNFLDSNTQRIKHAPVTFLISLGQDAYYLVLFDFAENKGLILRRRRHGPVTMDIVTTYLEWEAWEGPTLWKRIGEAFDWMDDTRPMPAIYEANWIPVYVNILSYKKPTNYVISKIFTQDLVLQHFLCCYKMVNGIGMMS
jgi:hypothetical protein